MKRFLLFMGACLLQLGMFAQTNSVNVTSIADNYLLVNTEGAVTVTMTNKGSAAVTSISYVTTYDGTEAAEQTIDVASVKKSKTFTASVELTGAAQEAQKEFTFKVTKVNGADNESTSASMTATVYTVKEWFTHRIAMEEFTGTGCGYCPRGWAGMEYLKEKYGDSFVGLALHRYNSGDPMYLADSSYKSVSFSGAPSSKIERGNEIDPFYGSDESTKLGIENDIDAALAKFTPVDVQVKGIFSTDSLTVNATATVKSNFDDQTYSLELALVADSLCQSTWSQSNYYYQYTVSQANAEGTLLEKFCKNGEWGTSSVKGLTFNDVVIAGNKNGTDVTVATAYTPVEFTGALTMPTKAKLLKAIKESNYQIFVAALVVDKTTKKILNACKTKVTWADEPEPSGIEEVANNNANVNANNAVYNLAGQRVDANAKGIVIINGKKVLK